MTNPKPYPKGPGVFPEDAGPKPSAAPKILDASGNALPAADPDKRYVAFNLQFEVEESRMLELDYSAFKAETKENLALMSDMILEQVLATRKKALAAAGRPLELGPKVS